MTQETIVVALGGNALQRKNEASATEQQRVAEITARQLAQVIKDGHRLVIVHGNGPQVGNIVLHEEAINTSDVPTMPFDSCGAMSQGLIGYWLQQALTNEFMRQGMKSVAVTIVTRMVVDGDDQAFKDPSKPIGPFYENEEIARSAASQRGFVVKEDAGRGWRRVVPSPKPLRSPEWYAIQSMLEAGVTPIVAGGGGVPVVAGADGGGLHGVEAVIDKDFSAAVIADMVNAQKLIILTAVDSVMVGFGTEKEKALRNVSIDEMKKYIANDEFAAGSMLPKVMASLNFVTSPGRRAIIGSLDDFTNVLAGDSGTTISVV